MSQEFIEFLVHWGFWGSGISIGLGLCLSLGGGLYLLCAVKYRTELQNFHTQQSDSTLPNTFGAHHDSTLQRLQHAGWWLIGSGIIIWIATYFALLPSDRSAIVQWLALFCLVLVHLVLLWRGLESRSRQHSISE